MERSTNHSPLRVSILSDSALQRTALKALLKHQGTEVVYENSLGGVEINSIDHSTDVLLIDLKSAGDYSLNRLEEIMDNNIPVLFNDGSTIPADDGPVHDDWVNNLTHKLYSLANKEISSNKPSAKSDIGATGNSISASGKNKGKKINNAPLKKSFPRVAIVSRSNTRRTVLKHILSQQGLKNIKALDFNSVDLSHLKNTVHILLVDQHNIGDNDQKTLQDIKSQHDLGYIICNSSKIPLTHEERQLLGKRLLQKLTTKAARYSVNKKQADPSALFESEKFESEKFVSNMPHADNSNTDATTSSAPLFKQDPGHWADKLSDALAGVRDNLKSMENRSFSKLLGKNKQLHEKLSHNEQEQPANPSLNNSDQRPANVIHLSVQNRKHSVTHEPRPENLIDNSETGHANEKVEEQNSGILDIFNSMVQSVKEVPADVDKTLDIYGNSTSTENEGTHIEDSHNADLDIADLNIADLNIAASEKAEDVVDINVEAPVDSVDKIQTADEEILNLPVAINDSTAEGTNNAEYDFNFDEDFDFKSDSENEELAFDLELRSLREELEIFEYDKVSLTLFEENPVKEKKRSILGINWSNPFK